jgi:uncharacterized SAM-binding protein YcdF (DUF218 family)
MVIREGKSTTTWENAREVARILSERKLSRVALVTSAWHMPRAMLAFARAGIHAVPAPTGYLTGDARLTPSDFLPGFEPLDNSATAIREYIGLAVYAARR